MECTILNVILEIPNPPLCTLYISVAVKPKEIAGFVSDGSSTPALTIYQVVIVFVLLKSFWSFQSNVDALYSTEIGLLKVNHYLLFDTLDTAFSWLNVYLFRQKSW